VQASAQAHADTPCWFSAMMFPNNDPWRTTYVKALKCHYVWALSLTARGTVMGTRSPTSSMSMDVRSGY